ncbi:MAG: hypothetical protein ABIX01_10155 [Chitinophagaceae bacterium]
MELHLRIIGVVFIILAMVHIQFPKRFNWKADLSGLDGINREMMYVHTFFIALTILLMGLLCLGLPGELMHTKLGNKLALGLFVFWVTRLLFQFFGYSSKLWKGKRTETIIHIVFSFLWTYVSVVFFIVFWQGRNI